MNTPEHPEPADKPPIMGTWRNLYALVLFTWALLVLVFFLITRAYA